MCPFLYSFIYVKGMGSVQLSLSYQHPRSSVWYILVDIQEPKPHEFTCFVTTASNISHVKENSHSHSESRFLLYDDRGRDCSKK